MSNLPADIKVGSLQTSLVPFDQYLYCFDLHDLGNCLNLIVINGKGLWKLDRFEMTWGETKVCLVFC